MANVNATNAAAIATTPPTKVKVNKQHGRIRYFESTYDQAVDGTAAVADTITWGDLPVGARIVNHLSQMNFGTGTAASTATVGDAVDPDRHLAATAINAAGVATLVTGAASGVAGYEITEATKTISSTIAGAGTAANQKITLRIAYVLD